MHLSRSLAARAAVLVAAVGIGVFGAAALAQSAARPDLANLEAVATRALEVNNRSTMLPANYAPGRLTAEQHRSLRASIQSSYAGVFAGPALTNRLNGFLSWADRIATDGSQPTTISADIVSVAFDPPAVTGDTASLTGTYDIVLKQGYQTTTGVSATLGGRYTNSFAMELSSRGAAWVVTGFSEQPVNFVPDPSMNSNLDVDPNPGATKPPLGSPQPVDPAQLGG